MNSLELTGTLQERGPVRYTPAGVAVIDLILEHSSSPMDGGHPRQVSFSMPVRCAANLVADVEKIGLGERVVVSGFLAPKRQNGRQLQLIATTLRFDEADRSVATC